MSPRVISDCELVAILNDTPPKDLSLTGDNLAHFFLVGMQNGQSLEELAQALYEKLPRSQQTTQNLAELEKLSAQTIVRLATPKGLSFAPSANANCVSDYSQNVLCELMKKAGVPQAKITSAHRTPEDQARIMYTNLQMKGAEHQKKLYGTNGDKVIAVCLRLQALGISGGEIQAAMAQKIRELGPQNVSRHCADPRTMNVIDIAPSSIPHEKYALLQRLAIQDSRITRFIMPPLDTSFHIEIPQPQGVQINYRRPSAFNAAKVAGRS